ncbi:hypothetical protein ACFXKW_38045 [Streptomyces sp. NPDC059193]|uniref:hypothetical protein n=1 Tax=Streptomyces sp. NPDC059193 TaxID=3346763 RepID=UPI0036866820
MTVTYTGLGTRPIGTMTCDQDDCDAVFHDGQAETEAPKIHIRAAEAGWQFCRPTPYHQTDVCPGCPPHERY